MDWETFHADYFKETGTPLPEAILPARKWWTNGATLCESEAPGGWSLGPFLEVLPMLEEACRKLPDTEFLFNRRDGPVLRDGSKNDLKNIKIPVIGFYEKGSRKGEGPREYAVPNYEDWGSRGSRGCDNRISSRIQQAFFRGSTTGPGTSLRDNARLRLCHMGRCREATIMNVAPTRFNRRLRCFRTRGKDGRTKTAVTFQRPSSFGHIHTAPPVPFSEWHSWAFTIYARGHAGATRFLRQLALGGVLIDFDPQGDDIPADKQPALPEVWGSSVLADKALPHSKLLAMVKTSRPAAAAADKHEWTHVHVTQADQLYSVIETLIEHPWLAQQLAENGRLAAVRLLASLVTSTRDVIARACGFIAKP